MHRLYIQVNFLHYDTLNYLTDHRIEYSRLEARPSYFIIQKEQVIKKPAVCYFKMLDGG